MDQSLLTLLKCPNCGLSLSQENELRLYCKKCNARYAIKNGTPIMYEGKDTPEDLQYDSLPDGISHPQSRFRQRLRSINIEASVRKLWLTYLSLSSFIEPRSPTEPVYWMSKVKSALPASPKNVLDLGGAGGHYKRYLATEEDLYVILEVDYYSYSVQKNLSRHQYIIGDGHTLLFSDESFDVISMFEVLEHVRNPFQIFSNCTRWLKPGGLIILSVPQYGPVHGWPSDYFRYTIYGLKELAKVNGLEVIDYWAMGGPFILIFNVIDNNFSSIIRFPIIRQVFRSPLLLLSRLGDFLFFRNNLRRFRPDTRGWMCIIRKPM